jgi:hypothetical protein
MYNGVSIVDYLSSVGKPTDFASRASMAASNGITGYAGTAEQNTQLLNLLRGGSGVQPTPQATTTPTATTQNPGVSTTPTGGSDALVQALISKGYNPTDAQNAANGPRAAELAKEYLGTGGNTGVSGVNTSFLNTPTIDLPSLYQNMYDTSGISDLQRTLSDQSKAFTEAKGAINDNPFLSEATRVGRVAKLETLFNDRTANIRNDIATKQADIETKLNIQTKQFDINSQQATQALSQFQTLLSSGALDNASGEDIANITRATGMSSSMIQAAINANKAKNVQTSIQSFDDGTNQGFVVINSNTGEIIKKDVIASSKPTSSGYTSTTKDIATNKENVTNDARQGALLQDLIKNYAVAGSGLSVEDIYKIYNSNSIYGKAVETLDQVLKGQFSTTPGQ